MHEKAPPSRREPMFGWLTLSPPIGSFGFRPKGVRSMECLSPVADAVQSQPRPRETPEVGSAYFPSIDGLRGVAIALVLWYHAPFLFRVADEFPRETTEGVFQKAFWSMSAAGWIGVDLFFVVSGFLITAILVRAGAAGSPLRAFWYRRGLRILPLAILYLLVLRGNAALDDPLHILNGFTDWALYFLYLGNIHISIAGWQPLVIMILWSLAVEEQFYLFWPVMAYGLGKRRLLVASLAIIALSPLVRSVVFYWSGYPAVYVFTLCRLDALASGAVLALLLSHEGWKAGTLAWCRRLLPFASLVLLTTFLAPYSPSYPQTRPLLFTVFGYTWIAVAFAVVVGASLRTAGALPSLLSAAPLRFVGKRCYGFYLWHALVAGVVKAGVQSGTVSLTFHESLILWLSGLVVVVTASWSFFEKPILKLKRLVPYPALPNGVAVTTAGR